MRAHVRSDMSPKRAVRATAARRTAAADAAEELATRDDASQLSHVSPPCCRCALDNSPQLVASLLTSSTTCRLRFASSPANANAPQAARCLKVTGDRVRLGVVSVSDFELQRVLASLHVVCVPSLRNAFEFPAIGRTNALRFVQSSPALRASPSPTESAARPCARTPRCECARHGRRTHSRPGTCDSSFSRAGHAISITFRFRLARARRRRDHSRAGRFVRQR